MPFSPWEDGAAWEGGRGSGMEGRDWGVRVDAGLEELHFPECNTPLLAVTHVVNCSPREETFTPNSRHAFRVSTVWWEKDSRGAGWETGPALFPGLQPGGANAFLRLQFPVTCAREGGRVLLPEVRSSPGSTNCCESRSCPGAAGPGPLGSGRGSPW